MGFLSNLLGNAGTVSPDKLQTDYGKLLSEDETIEIGFNVFRDTFVFTSKRLIIVDVQESQVLKLSTSQYHTVKSPSLALKPLVALILMQN